MATKIAAQGALGTAADTAIESTAKLRALRVNFCNTGTSVRTVTIEATTRRIAKFTLDPDESRMVGPHYLASGINLEAWQDVGTDVHYNISGEY